MSNVYLERLRAISRIPLVQGPTKPTEAPFVGFVGAATTRIPENEPANDARDLDEGQSERAAIMHYDGGIDGALADLLALHGGFPGIDWQGLALTEAQESTLWIVQRPNGLLTVLATVEPIRKPLSYSNAWPARFTTPEPADLIASAAPAAQAAVEKARQSCWDCPHLDTHQRPTCSRGHRVAWQIYKTLTYPRRFDATGCGDQA